MITLRDVTLRRGAKVLLDHVSTTINPGESVGLVGRNGAGKSTLFALFNGSLHEDGGEFSVPAQWQLAQVAQNMPETDESATAFVLGGDTRLMALRGALAHLPLHDLEALGDLIGIGRGAGAAQQELRDVGRYGVLALEATHQVFAHDVAVERLRGRPVEFVQC